MTMKTVAIEVDHQRQQSSQAREMMTEQQAQVKMAEQQEQVKTAEHQA